MRSRDDDNNNKPEAAAQQPPSQPAPAPAPHQGPAPTKPGLSVEERLARLEQKLVPPIGEL